MESYVIDSNIIIDYNINLDLELKFISTKRRIIITDENVFALYHRTIHSISKSVIIVKPGEQSKSFETYLDVLEQLFNMEIRKSDVIVGFGGGVVLDLAGFVAATILRGVRYASVPTTLLSMVDSSIGSKTGINTSFGKNLVGAYKKPELTLIDPMYLETLKDIDYKNGLAEMFKMALCFDVQLYYRLKEREHVTTEEIHDTIIIKQAIVKKDPFDLSVRNILNFGHSYGHAIEITENYEIPHGLAVAIGIVYEMETAYQLKLTRKKILQEVVETFIHKGLIKWPLKDKNIYKEHIKRDKKIDDDHKIKFTYIKEIGRGAIANLPLEMI